MAFTDAPVDDPNDPNDPVTFTHDDKVELGRLAATLSQSIPYCPWTPNAGPQTNFLLDFGRESLYGGAAGGGKSIALMMGASQFLMVPGYTALLLRKSYRDLQQPLALMDIAEQWWGGQRGVRYAADDRTYWFNCLDPAGNTIGLSRIVFGYLDNENDRYNYQGGGYHFAGFDELTQFKERDYRYLFSRMRRPTHGALARLPMRMRCTTNPGGTGHEWVHKRFIVGWEKWKKNLAPRPRRNFHPAILEDNPKLDREDYIQSLNELDPITRAQLLKGDWNIRPDGRMFKARWFKFIDRDQLPANAVWARYWDMASTEEDPTKEPDYTVGALVGRDPEGNHYIADIRRWREEPATNDLMILATKIFDTQHVAHGMEQEPGSSGKTAIHHYRQTVFYDDYTFRGIPSSGSKITRARPVASRADAGQVFIVRDAWNDDWLNEVEIFPDGLHDDQVDATSGAFEMLKRIIVGAIQLGVINEEFAGVNPWRPDEVPDISAHDVMSQKAVLGARIAEVRLTQEQARQAAMNAFSV